MRDPSASDNLPDPENGCLRAPLSRRLLAIAALCFLALVAALVVYLVFSYFTVGSRLAPDRAELELIEQVLDPEPGPGSEDPEGRHTYVLMLGNDRQPGQERARTDTIILARLSQADRSIVLISIPRDTRTEVPGHGITKINHASAYGGVPLTIETVKRYTGLPVHHYVEIDFEGFGAIVDLLGGIEMEVERPVDYGQGVVVGTGWQHLDGRLALAVVRNRRTHPDGDLGRVRTQRAFLSAVANKASSPQKLTRLPRIISQSADHIETDLSVGQIVALVRGYRDALQGDLPGYTVPGSPRTIGGVSYIVTDDEAAGQLFEAIRRGELPAADDAGR